ncbi:MAG: SPASM domain-containing protein [Kiritimatiellae bacterium]|nr:SPASM domain-containing protein [Kiritimatiellia bacterium]
MKTELQTLLISSCPESREDAPAWFADVLSQARAMGVRKVVLLGGGTDAWREQCREAGVALECYPTLDAFPACSCERHDCPLIREGCCYLTPDGSVFPCPRTKIVLGNVRETSLDEIVAESEVLDDLRHPGERIKEACASCTDFPACCGCRGNAYEQTGDYLAADPFCPRNKDKAGKVLPVPATPYIPHRGRAVRIDRILEIGEKGGVVEAVIRPGSDICKDDGVVDECALLELMAQASGALYVFRVTRHEKPEELPGALVGVNAFHVYGTPKTGERLLLRVKKQIRFDVFYLVNVRVFAGERLLAEGVLKLYEGSV